MMRTQLAFVATLLLAASGLWAQARVRTVDGQVHEGRSLGFADEKLLLGAGNTAKKIPLSTVIDFDFGESSLAPPAKGAGQLRFELARGDLLFGPVIDGDFDAVRVDSAVLGPVALSIDAIQRVIVLQNLTSAISVDELRRPEGDDRDFLFVKAGSTVDRVAGELEKFRRQGLLFAWNEQGASEFDFAKDGVLALCLGSTEPPELPKGLRVAVDFRDSGRLQGSLEAASSGGLALVLPGGTAVPLRPEKVLRVSVRGGDFEYLSDMADLTHRETPYIEGGLRWGLHRDRGLAGGRIEIGGRYFSKALALHSRSEIDLAVPAKMAYFDAWVGIDDAVAARSAKGAVSFSVIADGKVVAGPILKRGGEKATRIKRLGVKGVKKLTLRADFADRHHFNAWAVWGDAMLIKGD